MGGFPGTGFSPADKQTTAGHNRYVHYGRNWRALEERLAGAPSSSSSSSRSSSSGTSGSGQLDRQYLWSPLDRWTLIRRQRATSGSGLAETHYVLKDFLDPVAIITTSASIVERYGYDAFGPVRFMTSSFGPQSGSTVAWNFLFHAEFRDDESELYNYGFRYYDTNLGRWPSRDPLGGRGSGSLYPFAANNAASRRDMLGKVVIGDLLHDLLGPIPPSVADAVEEVEEIGEALEDNLVNIPEPFGFQDRLDREDAASVELWRLSAILAISAQIDCETKPTSVSGFSGIGSSNIRSISKVVLTTPDPVQVTWTKDGCCWRWETTLIASNDFGASKNARFRWHGAEWAEWLLWGLFPANHIPVGQWPISDRACCDNTPEHATR